MPGETKALLEVPAGHLGLGLGIHGEPGIRDVAMLSATELADLLVDTVLSHAPPSAGNRVGSILDGLGPTKYEELFLLWGVVAGRLREHGYTVVGPEVGELVTSLDMGGCSPTLMWLDEELEPLWCADAYTPACRKVAAELRQLDPPDPATASEKAETATRPPAATPAAREPAGWQTAARTATQAAAATADLRPRVGRARPLAEKSLGTPDAGATSMGLLLTALGEQLADQVTEEDMSEEEDTDD